MTSAMLIGIACFVGMIALIILGVPVAISMFATSAIGFLVVGGPQILIRQLSDGVFALSASYSFAVVPLFMIVGVLAGETGLAAGAYTAAKKWVGKYRGGLLYTTIVANALFGACSGISSAGTVVFCKIAMPELRKAKYDDSLSLGCISAAGALSVLIPPSIPIITMCIMTEVSIAPTLLCGVAAGIIVMLVMMVMVFITSKIHPEKVPAPTEEDKNVSFKEKLISLKLIIPIVFVFGIIIGGSLFGWFPATVGGAVATVAICLYALIIKRMPFKRLALAIWDGASMFAGIYLMIMGGNMFSRLVTMTNLASSLANLIAQANIAPVFIFGLVVIFYLFIGCFMSVMPVIIITSPVIVPLLIGLGFNQYAIIVCLILLCELGNITPPVGNSVFITASVMGESSTKIFKGVLPFFIAMLICCVLFGILPSTITWLPSLLGSI